MHRYTDHTNTRRDGSRPVGTLARALQKTLPPPLACVALCASLAAPGIAIAHENIVWRNTDGQVHHWLIEAGERQGGYDIWKPVGSEWRLAGVGDVDGDGNEDLVWEHQTDRRVHVWKMEAGKRVGAFDLSRKNNERSVGRRRRRRHRRRN